MVKIIYGNNSFAFTFTDHEIDELEWRFN